MRIELIFHSKINLWNVRLPLNKRFFGNMEAIYLSNQAILFWEHRSSLENVFRCWIFSAINEAMVKRSVDLWSILVKLFFIVLVEIVEVDRVLAEEEVIEGGDADVLVHRDLFILSKCNIPWDFSWSFWIYLFWFYWFFFKILFSFLCDIVSC